MKLTKHGTQIRKYRVEGQKNPITIEVPADWDAEQCLNYANWELAEPWGRKVKCEIIPKRRKEWKDIDKDLPAQTVDVLCYCEDGTMIVGKILSTADGKRKGITQWMCLPRPPERRAEDL